MGSGRYRCAPRAPRMDSPRQPTSLIAAALLALCSAACTTDGLTTGSVAAPRPSVAFESIDGPPEGVFRKLVQDLSDEAEARQLAVVSREGAARYRIRGYMAAQVHRGRTTIAWVWDIYDADQNRALRISGEEDAGRTGKDAWAETDDRVLRRISRAGVERLVSFLAAPAQEANARAPVMPGRLFTVTSDDFAPESAGIFRTSSDASATATDAAEAATSSPGEPADVPLPKRRPMHAGLAGADALALVSR
jgi:hypothetical protein